jgi:hypothetical protein
MSATWESVRLKVCSPSHLLCQFVCHIGKAFTKQPQQDVAFFENRRKHPDRIVRCLLKFSQELRHVTRFRRQRIQCRLSPDDFVSRHRSGRECRGEINRNRAIGSPTSLSSLKKKRKITIARWNQSAQHNLRDSDQMQEQEHAFKDVKVR